MLWTVNEGVIYYFNHEISFSVSASVSFFLFPCSKGRDLIGGFFSESAIRFSNIPISKENYSKKLSWTWNLNFPPTTVLSNGREF